MISLCSPKWPENYYVNQSGHKNIHTDPLSMSLPSPSSALRLTMSTRTPGFYVLNFVHINIEKEHVCVT